MDRRDGPGMPGRLRQGAQGLGLGLLVALAGCTAGAPGPASAYGSVEPAIRAFYEGRALELNATCTTPYISNITRMRTVSETDRQVVLEVDYLYDVHVRPSNYGIAACRNFASRSFTLAKTGTGLEVVGMSGEQRS